MLGRKRILVKGWEIRQGNVSKTDYIHHMLILNFQRIERKTKQTKPRKYLKSKLSTD